MAVLAGEEAMAALAALRNAWAEVGEAGRTFLERTTAKAAEMASADADFDEAAGPVDLVVAASQLGHDDPAAFGGVIVSERILESMGVRIPGKSPGAPCLLDAATVFGLGCHHGHYYVETMVEAALRLMTKRKPLPEHVTADDDDGPGATPPDHKVCFRYRDLKLRATLEDSPIALNLFTAEED